MLIVVEHSGWVSRGVVEQRQGVFCRMHTLRFLRGLSSEPIHRNVAEDTDGETKVLVFPVQGMRSHFLVGDELTPRSCRDKHGLTDYL